MTETSQLLKSYVDKREESLLRECSNLPGLRNVLEIIRYADEALREPETKWDDARVFLTSALVQLESAKEHHFRLELANFLRAGYRLARLWDDELVTGYPKYMPDFEEFLVNFGGLLEQPDDAGE